MDKYTISHLVAVSENNVIGRGSELPWNLPDDFKFFKNKTWGMVVIMGRKTYESLNKPLPGRTNIVITRDVNWKRDQVIVSQNMEKAIEAAIETDCKEIFIIGGGEIFRQSMEIANRIYITRVHTSVDGDIFYPEIDETIWKKLSGDFHDKDDKHIYSFTFETWERINPIDH